MRVKGFHDGVREPSARAREAVAGQGPSVEEELREFFGVEEFVDGLTGLELRERLTFAPTCNICGIHAGYGGPRIAYDFEDCGWPPGDFRVVEQRHAAARAQCPQVCQQRADIGAINPVAARVTEQWTVGREGQHRHMLRPERPQVHPARTRVVDQDHATVRLDELHPHPAWPAIEIVHLLPLTVAR